MEKKDVLTKILAVFGTVLMWLPVLAPIILGVGSLVFAGIFRFVYLLPAEMFPSAVLGGAMLLWAALRTHSHRKLIGWGLVTAVVMLFGGQAIAVVTGLASGETEPTTWLMALVLGPLVIYALLLVAVGVGGVRLVRDLYKRPDP